MSYVVPNTFKAVSSCLQHQHWPRRHNYSWLCKTEICFMGLKLIFIFPDCPLPVLADTNPILSLPHCCHLSMSLSLTQAAAKHSPSHLSLSLLIPSFFTRRPHSRGHSSLSLSHLPLWLHPFSAVDTSLTLVAQPGPGLRWLWNWNKGGRGRQWLPSWVGHPACKGKRQDTVVTVASGRTKTRAGVSRETGRKGGT